MNGMINSEGTECGLKKPDDDLSRKVDTGGWVSFRMEGLNVFNNWQPLTPWHETTVEPLEELEAYADVNGENNLGWKDWRIVKRTIETIPPNERGESHGK